MEIDGSIKDYLDHGGGGAGADTHIECESNMYSSARANDTREWVHHPSGINLRTTFKVFI